MADGNNDIKKNDIYILYYDAAFSLGPLLGVAWPATPRVQGRTSTRRRTSFTRGTIACLAVAITSGWNHIRGANKTAACWTHLYNSLGCYIRVTKPKR